MNESFFRKEALARLETPVYGSPLMITPLSYTIMTLMVAGLILSLIILGSVVQLTEKKVVRGYLNISKGIVRVYPKSNGFVLKRFVNLGDHIRKGDPMILIQSSNVSNDTLNHQSEFDFLKKNKDTIESDLVSKNRELMQLESLFKQNFISLKTVHAKQAEIRQLMLQKNQIEIELLKHKNSRLSLIRSPTNGVVSNALFQESQTVSETKVMFDILPDASSVVAELFIPVSAIAFLQSGDLVRIQYDAFPHRHFGSSKGVIKAVSQSSLLDQDEDKPIKVGGAYYKAYVTLDSPYLVSHGKKYVLKPGMMFSAVILGAKKTVWHWIFDPIRRLGDEVLL